METLIQFILVHYAFILIGEKYDVRGKLRNFSQKVRVKLFYNIAECLFCYTHHIAVLMLPFLILENGWLIEYFLYPLASTGALFLITKQKQ